MDLSGVRRPVRLPVRPDASGKSGPTRKVARGPGWRRTSKGFYVPSSVDGTGVDQRVVEAATILPETWGGVTGWAALGWSGGRWFDGTPWGGGPTRPVTLAVGGNRAIRPQLGIDTSEERLAPGDLLIDGGVRLTSAVRSVAFEMRYARNLLDAVIVLDMACFNDLVSIEELVAYAEKLNGWTGIPRCREAALLANENAWSPREVGMRIIWKNQVGCPRLVCNVPIFGPDGKHIGTPDLFDVEAGVAGEYDSALHLAGARRARDLVREDVFRRHGLECVTMVTADNVDPTDFIVRLRSAYDRASMIPGSRKSWTIEQPSWWRDTSTVAARRALGAEQRARLLAHRLA